ncbi:hypothetical protein TNCV_2880341 [Trichonephila clavipes]|uniref:Uncharacterized protein n=1 Tax=Trichonephila clavipes TaxID=2585209 RepID=A0A8X6W2H8_TRICX|nr:hypothetical protein TNCV_2880341 [Trichonephila clavipes]
MTPTRKTQLLGSRGVGRCLSSHNLVLSWQELIISTGLSIGRLEWALRGPDKLDLTRFSVYKFRSSNAKGACRSSVPRAQNEPKSALLIICIYSPHQSASGETFIYPAGITVITFFLYNISERVKRHRVLPVKVSMSSTHLSNHMHQL